MLICDMCSGPVYTADCLQCDKPVSNWCGWCNCFTVFKGDGETCQCKSAVWECWCDLCGRMSFVGGCPHITDHLIGVTCPETAVFTQIGDAFLIDDSLGTHFCPDCQKNTLPGECPHWELVTDVTEIPL